MVLFRNQIEGEGLSRTYRHPKFTTAYAMYLVALVCSKYTTIPCEETEHCAPSRTFTLLFRVNAACNLCAGLEWVFQQETITYRSIAPPLPAERGASNDML